MFSAPLPSCGFLFRYCVCCINSNRFLGQWIIQQLCLHRSIQTPLPTSGRRKQSASSLLQFHTILAQRLHSPPRDTENSLQVLYYNSLQSSHRGSTLQLKAKKNSLQVLHCNSLQFSIALLHFLTLCNHSIAIPCNLPSLYYNSFAKLFYFLLKSIWFQENAVDNLKLVFSRWPYKIFTDYTEMSLSNGCL